MSRHVVLALWTLGRGGAERMVVDLARRLPKRGYIPRIVALGGGGDLEEEVRASGIELSIAPRTHDRRATMLFTRQMLAELTSDAIVHTHLGADHWFGYLASRKGHAWVSTIHNDDRDESWMKQRLHVWTWNRVQGLACVSRAVQEFWQENGLKNTRLNVIPNGIDLARFTPRTKLTYQDTPLIVSVGRLVPQKRHEWLLRALAPIHTPWRLEIVGDGPLRGTLEALADTLGIRPRVAFRGVVSDVRSVFARADLFALPSAWEGQGIVVMEAAASGVPLLLSDRPAFREWLDETSACLIPDDISAWTEALESALYDPSRMQKQAWHAYEQVCAFGDVERMVDAYVELYEKTLFYAHSSRE